MALRKIELLGADVLRRRAEEIPTPGPELKRLVADMFETMYDAQGIGLAAPQIGLGMRLIVVDVKDEGGGRMALIDPAIVEMGADRDRYDEGCLSIPGISGSVERPTTCVVDATDASGNPVRVQAEGLLARCLQHEIDHLNGVLFVDHLSPIKRNMVLAKYRKLVAK